MIYLISKSKEKSPLTAEIVTKFTLSTYLNGQLFEYSYYGYTKQKAVSQFNKLIKDKKRNWFEYLAK
jgi:hypothetical protein